jgi:hypothetical protein
MILKFWGKRLLRSEYNIHSLVYQFAFTKGRRLKIIAINGDDIVYDRRVDDLGVQDWCQFD